MANVECSRGGLSEGIGEDGQGESEDDSDGERPLETAVQERLRMNDNGTSSIEGEEEEEAEAEAEESDIPIDERDGFVDDSDTEGSAESEDDGNDIIDIIPSPSTTRHRAISQSHRSFIRSRHSFYNSNSNLEDVQLSPAGASAGTGYGTFRSLGGI